MLTLHTVTQDVRTAAKWVGLAIGVILIILLVLGLGNSIKQIFFPTPPPPPTVRFGKLSEVLFPVSPVTQKLSYSLNTLTGSLPNFPDRMSVYRFLQNAPNLLALQRMQNKVADIGFIGQPIAITSTTYQWNDNSEINRKLTANIVDTNFTLTSDYINNPSVLAASYLPKETDAVKKVISFMTPFGVPADIDMSKTKTTLFSINNSTLVPSTSFSSSQVVRVDYYQQDVDKYPIMYSHPPYSSINFLVAGGQFDGQIVQANFHHEAVASDSATYPIITAQTAFDELKKGNGYVASYDGAGQVSIKDVSLAYYIGDGSQDYLWPVVVFKGDENFYAYVPAVKSEWIKKANEQ